MVPGPVIPPAPLFEKDPPTISVIPLLMATVLVELMVRLLMVVFPVTVSKLPAAISGAAIEPEPPFPESVLEAPFMVIAAEPVMAPLPLYERFPFTVIAFAPIAKVSPVFTVRSVSVTVAVTVIPALAITFTGVLLLKVPAPLILGMLLATLN